jgi:hypothetical protein
VSGLIGARHRHPFVEIRVCHRTTKELKRLEVFATGGIDLAVASARNYRLLRRKGRTVRKTLDCLPTCLIATFCLLHGHTLLHCDRDFDPFEKELGLRVVHAESE